MIECPICHVQNDDRSLFCAECGQRFSGQSAQAPEAPANLHDSPSLESTPKRPAVKLHSPILDGGGGGQEPEPSPGRRPFGKASGNASDAVRPKRPAPNNDSDFSGPGDANPPTHRKGLRSPLLDFDDEDVEGEYQPQGKGNKSSGGGMFPHRSNSRLSNTGGQPVDQDDLNSSARSNRPNKGLRSPLLGGDDEYEDMDDTPPLVTNKGTSSRLRSPVLGGGRNQNYQADYDEVVEDDNPNLLRSPLLAARAPIQDRVKPPANEAPKAPQPDPGSAQAPTNSPWGGGFGQPPQPTAPQPSFAEAPAPTPDPLPSWTTSAPAAQSAPPAPAMPGFPDVASSGLSSVPAPPAPAPKVAPPTSYETPSRSSVSADSSTESSGSLRSSSRNYGDALPSTGSTSSKRSVISSRLLPVNDDDRAPHAGPTSPPGYAGFGKFMAIPLGAAVLCKLWYLHDMGATAFSSMSFLLDQLSQAVVIICVLVFTLMVSSEPRR